MSILENCSICGGEAKKSEYLIDGGGNVSSTPSVSCCECNNRISVNESDYSCDGGRNGWDQASIQWHNALMDAVGRWNSFNKPRVALETSGINVSCLSSDKRLLIELILGDRCVVEDVTIDKESTSFVAREDVSLSHDVTHINFTLRRV